MEPPENLARLIEHLRNGEIPSRIIIPTEGGLPELAGLNDLRLAPSLQLREEARRTVEKASKTQQLLEKPPLIRRHKQSRRQIDLDVKNLYQKVHEADETTTVHGVCCPMD